jgi:hypothetical protein
MKQLSKADNSAKFKAYLKALHRTKTELLRASRKAHLGWPHNPWQETDEAYFHRTSVNASFVEKRGGLPRVVVNLALNDRAWETKETVAGWLRDELRRLREAEAERGAAPVRRGKTLSRIEISEIAIELLGPLVGESLFCLFQELLDIDRHRIALDANYSKFAQAAEMEAMVRLQGRSWGVRALAKQMSVSPSTITRWKRSLSFCERVELAKRRVGEFLREDYFEQIKAAAPEATEAECFRRAFQMYLESIPQRQAALLERRQKDRKR